MAARVLAVLALVLALVLPTTGLHQRVRVHCTEDTSAAITTHVHEAQLVFTGKVISVLDALVEDEPGLEVEVERKLRVRIKRVLKGRVTSSGPVELLLPDEDKSTCPSRAVPRVHDTAIFLATSASGNPKHKLELLVAPLPLSLRNLDIVNAAVKGTHGVYSC